MQYNIGKHLPQTSTYPKYGCSIQLGFEGLRYDLDGDLKFDVYIIQIASILSKKVHKLNKKYIVM